MTQTTMTDRNREGGRGRSGSHTLRSRLVSTGHNCSRRRPRRC
jgi:hypothetical protein